MGNCFCKKNGVEVVEEMIKVTTANGGVMELYAPISAECITNEFPGHVICRARDASSPLRPREQLRVGQPYYLLPAISPNASGSIKPSSNYRMSFDQSSGYHSDNQQSHRAVATRHSSRGVWKVKLVISPEYLGEILAQESATQELVESLRTVAKCGNNTISSSCSSSSLGYSDQWSH